MSWTTVFLSACVAVADVQLSADFPVDTTPTAIEGRVVDSSVYPIMGLRVTVEPTLEWFEVPTVEAMIELHRERGAQRQETRTDAEGRFQFATGLVATREYLVCVYGAPWQPLAPLLEVASAGAHVSFAPPIEWSAGLEQVGLQRRVTLDGTPVDRARIDAPNMWVAGREWNWPSRVVALSEDRSGEWRATAFGVFASPVVPFVGGMGDVELALEPTTTVSGYLKPPRGELHLVHRETADLENRVSYDKHAGSFLLPGLTPGPYRFELRSNGATVQAWDVDVRFGFQRLPLEVRADRGHDVVIKVVDAAGHDVRVERIRVTVDLGEQKGGRSSRRHHSRSHAVAWVEGGRHGLRLDPEIKSWLDGGRCVELLLEASRPGPVSASVSVDPSDWRGEHTIVFEARESRGTIAFEVEDYVASGHEGRIDVGIEPWPDDIRRSWGDRIVDVFGCGTIGPVVVGEYDVVATVDRCEYYRESVTVERGVTSVSIPLPHFVELTVRFPDALHGQWGRLRLGSRPSATALEITAEPSVWRLVPGEYRIAVGTEHMAIRIEDSITVDFAQTCYRAGRINGVKEGGHLDRIGLKDGDLLVAIDGQEFAERRPSVLCHKRLDDNGSVVLTVEREGSRFDLRVEKIELADERIRAPGVLRDQE